MQTPFRTARRSFSRNLSPFIPRFYATGGYSQFNPIVPELMNVKKSKQGFRIFCLGGSSTQGYPYFTNGSFPNLLEAMLTKAQERKKIEVVNLGVTAMNSFSVLDFMREIPYYRPDLIIIYMGHNEFFGALGSASNLFYGHNRKMVQFFLRLQEIKIYLAAKDAFSWLKGIFIKPKTLTSTLMNEIVRVKKIPIKSELREITYHNFEANLTDIFSIASEHKIPVMIGTLVCNLKDFKPFDSEAPENGPKSEEFNQYRRKGLEAFSQKKDSDALEYFSKAIQISPEHAQTHFDLARTFYEIGDMDKAYHSFIRAKDLDIIPFRAPSKINQLIRNTSKSSGVMLVDLENIMNTPSKKRILGKPEMMEHLHPSFLGNYQIAVHFAKQIFQGGILQPEIPINWDHPEVVESIKESAGFTGIDIHAAYSKIYSLIDKWPFNVNNKEFRPPFIEADLGDLPMSIIENQKLGYKKLVSIHLKAGSIYYQKGDFRRAYREYNAGSRMFIFDGNVFLNKALALINLEDIPKAKQNLERAFDLNSNSPIAYKARAYISLREGKNQTAILDLNHYLHFHPKDVFVRYELASALLHEKRLQEALVQFENIEKQQKDYRDTPALIDSIKAKLHPQLN